MTQRARSFHRAIGAALAVGGSIGLAALHGASMALVTGCNGEILDGMVYFDIQVVPVDENGMPVACGDTSAPIPTSDTPAVDTDTTGAAESARMSCNDVYDAKVGFGDVTAGTRRTARIGLINAGSGPTVFWPEDITITGEWATAFVVEPPQDAHPIYPGEAGTVAVSFVPDRTTARTPVEYEASLNIGASNPYSGDIGPEYTASITLTGTALPAPAANETTGETDDTDTGDSNASTESETAE